MSMGYIENGVYHKVAGGGAFVPKPDWAHAVDITREQLIAGYAAPSNGMFTGAVYFANNSTSARQALSINRVTVAVSALVQPEAGVVGDLSAISLQVPVAAGDLLQVLGTPHSSYVYMFFIPWKEA